MPSLSNIIGLASRGADLYFVFRFLRLLTMKFTATDAYKLGIIDKKGKALKKSADLETVKEKSSYTMLHRMVFKIRGLLEKIPIVGKTILLNYAAALFLLKEQKDTRIWTDDGYMKRKLMEFLETDWEADAKFLKEEVDNMNRKSFNTFLAETKLEESQELQAMMALDDAGIEAVINRKGQIVINKKDLKNAQNALKKSFRKGGAPELKTEEVEIDEKTYFNIKKFGPVKPVTSRSMYLFARKLYDWANENAGANKKELKAIAKKIEKENKLPDFKEMPEIVQSMMTQEFGIKEEVEIDEVRARGEEVAVPPTIGNLKQIVKAKQNAIFMFKDGKARVDAFSASAMSQVYDALKPATKKKFEDMIKTKAGFMKSQAFAMKMLEGVEFDLEEDPDLEKIVKELENASKMHLGQSKRIQKHLDKMKKGEIK